MIYVFPIKKAPRTDHCEECGGEEYEGCGPLSGYLVVTLDDCGSVYRYSERHLCDECVKEMRVIFND